MSGMTAIYHNMVGIFDDMADVGRQRHKTKPSKADIRYRKKRRATNKLAKASKRRNR